MHVLVSEKTAAHLPVSEINHVCSVHSALKKHMTEISGAEIPPNKVCLRIGNFKQKIKMTFLVATWTSVTGAQWEAC